MATYARLESRLPAIIAEIEIVTNEAAELTANKIAEDARAAAPFATGRLRDSIHVEEIDNGYAVVADATDEDGFPYPLVIEYGGRSGVGVGPRAFMTPAAEANREMFLSIAATSLAAI